MEKTTEILLDWTVDEGTPWARRALVVMGPIGALCAYVGVPADHPLAGRDYDDMPLDCHGGLTFSDIGDGNQWPSGWHWYGWDYGHYGDYLPFMSWLGGHKWTVEEVESEVNDVMNQLRDMLINNN